MPDTTEKNENGKDKERPPVVVELVELVPTFPSNADEEEFEVEVNRLLDRLREIYATGGMAAFLAALSIVCVESGIPAQEFTDAIAQSRAVRQATV